MSSTAVASSRDPNTVVPFLSYLASVRTAVQTRGGIISPSIRAAATTYGNEGIGSDGGYLVPPEFSARLVDMLLGEAALLPRCAMVETTKNAIGMPVDPNPGYRGGPTVYNEDEGATLRQSKVSVARPEASRSPEGHERRFLPHADVDEDHRQLRSSLPGRRPGGARLGAAAGSHALRLEVVPDAAGCPTEVGTSCAP